MKNLKKIILLVCVAAVLNTVNACGRYSEPSPIEGSGYPHNYPQK